MQTEISPSEDLTHESPIDKHIEIEEVKVPISSPELPHLIKSENDIRIAVIGNVDSGKTTVVGVLTKNLKDDGNGLARQHVFNFPHEKTTGRTSSIAHELMGFTEDLKQVTPLRAMANKNDQWNHIMKDAKKTVTFIDLCGHEKYLKTTVFGLSGMMPDYAMIIVGANMGVSKMTKEHLGISLALNIPFIVVITKIDLAPPEVRKNTVQTLSKILHGAKKTAMPIKPEDDLKSIASLFQSGSITPIFSICNITEEGIPELRSFLALLKSRILSNPVFKTETDPVEFSIDDIFSVVGVGVVVSGTMLSGTVQLNQILQLGPDELGGFTPVVVKSIHYQRTFVDQVTMGQSCCFAIKYHSGKKEQLKRNNVRKGMVLVDKVEHPKAAWEFSCEVMILHHATMIQEKYQAVIHCGVIRQTAEVANMNKDYLKTGDKGEITFRFVYKPEFIHVGMPLLFMEGRTKGLGRVSSINYEYKRPIAGITKTRQKRKYT